MSGKTENVMAMVSTLGAAALIRKLVDKTWEIGSKGKKAPNDPSDPDVTLAEAVLFAVISGAAIQVVRTMLARRFARNDRREARVQRATSPAPGPDEGAAPGGQPLRRGPAGRAQAQSRQIIFFSSASWLRW